MLLFSTLVLGVAGAATSAMYGLSDASALISIDLKTGKLTELTKEHKEELDAQELSAIDVQRSRYYTAGVNSTTNKVNLCVWSLSTGHKEQQVELPFESSPFVGVGEALDVDPNDGTIVIMGHDPSKGGHHCVYTLDPETFKPTFVADLGGDMTVDMLGGSTTYDFDAKVAYVMTAFNDSKAHPATPIASKFNAVHLTTGKVDTLDNSLTMSSFAYDSKTKRVYGTTVTSTSSSSAAALSAATVRRPRASAAGALSMTHRDFGDDGLKRALAYFDATKRDKLVTVAPLPLTMAIGDVHTYDPSARVHYTLLAGKANNSAYAPTDFCSKHGEACGTGATCCCPPPCTDAEKYGYCFSVDDCSKIPSGDPLAVPNFLVGVHADTGKVTSMTPLCSLEPGPKTNPNRCPWSVESAGTAVAMAA